MREAYARGYASRIGVDATVGIEIREGDDVEGLTRWAHDRCVYALAVYGGNHTELVLAIEYGLLRTYPDRAYFIETEEDGKGVQVYDPRDFVKERCACAGRCQ